MHAQANGPSYDVETGRRDGVVSDLSLAENMPDVEDSIQQLKAKFMEKGLSEKDLVLLSGTFYNILTISIFIFYPFPIHYTFIFCGYQLILIEIY